MEQAQELKEIVARLRGPDGCPWDKEQTHESVCDCLIEEVAEVLDTIDRGDMEHMQEELGDLLLHVYFHAQMAEEAGHFTVEDVHRGINEKLVRRHPHVFGDMELEGTEAVLNQWEKIKGEEKPSMGPFKALPPKLPALLYARDVYKQIVKSNVRMEDLIDDEHVDILQEGLNEELAGRLIFELAGACREKGIDPESALRRYTTEMQEAFKKRHASTAK